MNSAHQIGSYFGASLSLLDVDSDGDSDFLLVGAPLFHQSQPRAEGKLYVYTFSDGVWRGFDRYDVLQIMEIDGSGAAHFLLISL